MLNGRKFNVYNIDGFSFDKSLDITTEKGLYCFTSSYNAIIKVCTQPSFLKKHRLLYLGKASGQEGINGRLTIGHDEFKDLKGKCNSLCVYICKEKEDAKSIETEILLSYGFELNEKENNTDEVSIVDEV